MTSTNAKDTLMVQLDRGDSIDALWAQTVEEKEQGDNIDMLWEQMKSDSPGSRQGKTNEFASDTLPNPFELYLHWQTCLTAADEGKGGNPLHDDEMEQAILEATETTLSEADDKDLDIRNSMSLRRKSKGLKYGYRDLKNPNSCKH